jgi:3-deoxy-manno-octulosonate cytidylyltransferase (CMP-KDO synthetase)
LQTGSDRVAYVAKSLDTYDVVVNLQGDEPFVTADMLSALVEPYLQGHLPPMTTLACPIKSEEMNDPNFVKVVYNKKNEALYFSRSPIPFYRQVVENAPVRRHMGLYAYSRSFLLEYTSLEQTLLEKSELLEQLRVLENGFPIIVCHTEKRVLEINTPEELALAKEILAGEKSF